MQQPNLPNADSKSFSFTHFNQKINQKLNSKLLKLNRRETKQNA